MRSEVLYIFLGIQILMAQNIKGQEMKEQKDLISMPFPEMTVETLSGLSLIHI